MATHTIDQAHREPTRLAGIMYLLTMATANFADFYVRRQLFVPADPQQTLRNIAASGLLVRFGIGSDLITIAASVKLVVALYVILKPINRSAALVAVFWWLLECAIAAGRYFEFFGSFVSPERQGFFASCQHRPLGDAGTAVSQCGPGGKSNCSSPFWFGIDHVLLSVV